MARLPFHSFFFFSFACVLLGWRNTNCRNNEVSSLGKNLMVQEPSEMKQISHSVLRLIFLQGGS